MLTHSDGWLPVLMSGSQILSIAVLELNYRHAGRTQLFVEEADGRGWGYYSGKELHALMLWLEHGGDPEQELADRIHETFEACLQPAADPEASLHLPF